MTGQSSSQTVNLPLDNWSTKQRLSSADLQCDARYLQQLLRDGATDRVRRLVRALVTARERTMYIDAHSAYAPVQSVSTFFFVKWFKHYIQIIQLPKCRQIGCDGARQSIALKIAATWASRLPAEPGWHGMRAA